MPNGDPDFHLKEEPKLTAFFQTIAEVLVDFSRRHNLKLQKYYHQAPSWDFTFRHPQGGVGKIEVCQYSDNMVFLASLWWHDDYDSLTRFTKGIKHEAIPLDTKPLLQALEASLRLILSWRFGEWDESHAGYDSWKKTWTKPQFDALIEDYPVLRI